MSTTTVSWGQWQIQAYFRLIKTGQLWARAHNCPVLINLKYGVKKIVQGTSYEVSRVNLSRGQIFHQSCPGRGGGGGGYNVLSRGLCAHMSCPK